MHSHCLSEIPWRLEETTILVRHFLNFTRKLPQVIHRGHRIMVTQWIPLAIIHVLCTKHDLVVGQMALPTSAFENLADVESSKGTVPKTSCAYKPPVLVMITSSRHAPRHYWETKGKYDKAESFMAGSYHLLGIPGYALRGTTIWNLGRRCWLWRPD